MNPAEWLARSGRDFGSSPALFHGTELQADYAEFTRMAGAIGADLCSRGIGPGDRVAVYLGNCPEYLPLLYGIWFVGACAVPINGKLHPGEVAWITENAGARLIYVADPETGVACAPEGCDIVAMRSAGFAQIMAGPALDWPVTLGADDPVWLFYTSGTTGRPKGAMLSGGNLLAMSLSYFADVDDVSPEDCAFYAAPMSHGAGLYNFVHVLRAARHVVPKSGGFDPREILDLAGELRNVSMFAAPTMVRRLVDAARGAGETGEGIKTIVYGGGPMYLADIQDALTVMGPKFVQIYGQGESPMCITALSRADLADRDHPDWARRLASVGRAQSVVSVRVVGEDGTPLGPGEIGEVVVQGAPVMLGYLDNPSATDAALRDGWLWTGDMGAMSHDGYLTLHDRAKDVVISGGSNIYPREVEEILLTHQQVAEVSVIGAPDPEWGEVVVAYVVGDAVITDAELDRLCTENIARFKRPKAYVFVPELPKNNYGKVLKTALREDWAKRSGVEPGR